jgi:hypothetical protein
LFFQRLQQQHTVALQYMSSSSTSSSVSRTKRSTATAATPPTDADDVAAAHKRIALGEDSPVAHDTKRSSAGGASSDSSSLAVALPSLSISPSENSESVAHSSMIGDASVLAWVVMLSISLAHELRQVRNYYWLIKQSRVAESNVYDVVCHSMCGLSLSHSVVVRFFCFLFFFFFFPFFA